MASIPTRSGSRSAHGNLMASGAAHMGSGKMDRHGPSSKNVTTSRKGQAHPAGAIRSTGQQVKGPDQGAG